MAKKKKRSSRRKNINLPYSGGMKGILTKSALVLGGLYVGNMAAKALQKKGLNGEDLLGLDGTASKFAAPAILIAGGLAGITMSKNRIVNHLASGVLLVGGAKAVNAIAGKNVVALGEADEDESQVMMPGVGQVQLPGVGINYDDLPDNNTLMTQYQGQPMGESVYVDENGNPIEGSDDEDVEGIGDDDVEGIDGGEDEEVDGIEGDDDEDLLGIDGDDDEEELL